MSLYVEVTCDRLGDRCWSNAGNNPQGGSIGTAREEARHQGWKRVNGRDICPNCMKEPEL